MTILGRPPQDARLRGVLVVLVALQAVAPARGRDRRVTRPRWLPAAAIASAIGGVVFAIWVFSTLAT
jgi:hypothetical protein